MIEMEYSRLDSESIHEDPGTKASNIISAVTTVRRKGGGVV